MRGGLFLHKYGITKSQNAYLNEEVVNKVRGTHQEGSAGPVALWQPLCGTPSTLLQGSGDRRMGRGGLSSAPRAADLPKAKTQAQAQGLAQVCTLWVCPQEPWAQCKDGGSCGTWCPFYLSAPVSALCLQSLDTHGGAMSCFNPQPGALCHTTAHSLLGRGEDWRVKGETTCGST